MRAASVNPLDVKFGLCVGLGTHETKKIPSKVDDHNKRLKDYDLRIGTLNVRTIHRVPGYPHKM